MPANTEMLETKALAYGEERFPNAVFTAMVMDVSISMKEDDYPPSRLIAAAEAGRNYVFEKRSHRPQDRVGIVQFSDEAQVICPLTPVGEGADRIMASLGSLELANTTNFAAGLETAGRLLVPQHTLLGGLFSAFGKPPENAHSPVAGTKHILFLSDGAHNHPESDPVKVSRRLRESGVVIDCVGVGARDQIDEDMLCSICSSDVNGEPRYRFIGDKQSLKQEFQRIARLRVL